MRRKPRNRGVIREEKEKNPPPLGQLKSRMVARPVIAIDSDRVANLNRSNEEVFRDRTRDQPRNLIGHGVWSPRRGRSRRVSAKSSKVAPLKTGPSV